MDTQQQQKRPETVGLDNLLKPKAENLPVVAPGFSNMQSFEFAVRAARLLAASSLVPEIYRGESGIANCVVALNMSNRMHADPLMVMQNLFVIEGRPSWSSQFIIAAINSCGRFSSLHFELSEPSQIAKYSRKVSFWSKRENRRVEEVETHEFANRECYAWAIEKATGARLESPRVSIAMAFKEGWLTKNASKWQSMPDLMLCYRAAAFFGRLYAPELLMGLPAAEEIGDVIEGEATVVPTFTAPPPPPMRPADPPASADPPPPADPISPAEAGKVADAIERVLDEDLATAPPPADAAEVVSDKDRAQPAQAAQAAPTQPLPRRRQTTFSME